MSSKFIQPSEHIHIVTSGSPRIERVEPVTNGVIRLVRSRAMWLLTASVDGIPFAYSRSTTSRCIAEQSFEEEREALSTGMDILDPASGWVPVE